MTPRQRVLLEEVYWALKEPAKSPYYGMPFRQATDILSDKLEEVRQISDYERAMKGIK